MQLEFSSSLAAVQAVENVSRVVVRSPGGKILMAALEWQPGQFFFAAAGDPKFEQLIRTLGLKDSEIAVETVRPPTVEQFQL